MKLRENDIICALATPPGSSAIAVVRLSGLGSWDLALSLSIDVKVSPRSQRVYLSRLVDSSGVSFDQALILFFSEGKSYTSQESVEIYCHGNMAIVEHLIGCLCDGGARVAEPGEFTFRAFMNQKLDLVQAESVLTLIHSDSVSQAKQCLRVLSGELSKTLLDIESGFLDLLSQLEAGIDFAAEGIELNSDAVLRRLCHSLADQVDQVIERSSRGKIVRHGFQVVLAGEPNAGKSSLLNALLGEEKALVTEVAGTTRDLVEGSILIDGVKFNFIDTAGVRNTRDIVESLGVKRALEIIGKSDLVLWVINPLSVVGEFDEPLFVTLRKLNGVKILPVFTHFDLGAKEVSLPRDILLEAPLWISNLDIHRTQGLIRERLRDLFSTEGLVDASLLIHAKQQGLLVKAKGSLARAGDELAMGLGHEIVALTLREGLVAVYQVLGKDFDDQILDRIFSEFCIGK